MTVHCKYTKRVSAYVVTIVSSALDSEEAEDIQRKEDTTYTMQNVPCIALR